MLPTCQMSRHLSSAAHLLLGDGWRMWTSPIQIRTNKKKDYIPLAEERSSKGISLSWEEKKKVG